MGRTLQERLTEVLAWVTRLRGVSVGAPVALALAATVLVFMYLRQAEQERLQVIFEGQTRNTYNGLQENFNVYLETVQSIGSLYSASEQVGRSEFNAFVARKLSQYRGIQALEWIPRVRHHERSAYEQAVRNDGFADFQFKQWTPDSDLKWTASNEQWADEYFPVYFVQPYEGNEMAFGIDLASNRTRREALERSRDTGQPVATARITLAQETGDQAGYLIFVPVYALDAPIGTTAERRDNLRGFALGVFRLGDIVDTVLADRDIEGIELRITDQSAQGDQRLLFESSRLGERGDTLQTSFPYDIGGRKWQFQFTPTPRYVAAHRGWQSWLVLIGGVLVALLFGALLNMVIGRAGEIEQLVQQRTEELQQTNAHLEQEVSDRKRAEQELATHAADLAAANEALAASNAELEQFAYVASHDLQEPMRKIASCCQILQDDYADKFDDEGREWVEFAVDSAIRMRNLIQDLLAFSRVGRTDTTFDEVDAQAICLAAIENLQGSIEETAADVTCRKLPKVRANRTQLGQLFQNLIGNGLKYRGDRVPEIEIGAELDGEFWQFYVKDNGIGIEPEYAERIFAIFQRLHSKQEYSGTGIGLAICKKIVERAGGKIWIESTPGEGTTFYFTWPQQGVEQDEQDREPVLSAH